MTRALGLQSGGGASADVVARVRAAICAEIDKQNGSSKWSLPFDLDKIARVAAAAALNLPPRATVTPG